MITFEYTDSFDYPAAAVFTLLTDLEARPTWIEGILEIRVTPEGPARLGTSYFEAGKFSGFKSEKTMLVTKCEQDRLVTLATPAEVRDSFCESYRIEPLSEGACRVHFTVEVGGVAKVAEFFMRQSMKKAQPQNAVRLKSVLASRTPPGKLTVS
ncbi:MAG: SRPBCC family protein [Dehalococcoidia bacterium]